jgi:transmembrane sensor
MTPSPSPRSSRMEEQASLWAAKLDGSTLTSAERTALEAWLAEDPAHRTVLSQYCQFSTDLEEILPALVLSGATSMPAEQPRRRWKLPHAGWYLSALAAAAAIAIGVRIDRPTPAVETIATSVAQRKTMRLADGTEVELNARTSLLVELGDHERHVRMADGEAFFTVAKDKSRPFIVETPAGSVRVTGTVFDVHAETSSDLAVTVVEGSVQVSPGQTPAGRSPAPVALRANDQLLADATHVTVRSLDGGELDNALAWRRGEVVFDGTSLAAAVSQFSRYHGVTINVAHDIAGLRVGGRYSLDNIDAFLAAVEAVLPVQVSHESSGAISVTPRTGS